VAHPLAGLLWTELFVFLVPAMVAVTGSGLEPRGWLGLRPPSRRAATLGLLTGASAWLLGSALFALARTLAPRALVERYDLSRLFEGAPAEQAAFVIAAAVAAPLCEEVAFRGHLAAAFHSRHRPATAIGASAVLFALLHLDPLRAPALLVLGVVYGWLAWRTGSLWTSILAHATNNAIASALFLASPSTEGEEPTLGAVLAAVAGGAVLLALVLGIARRGEPRPEPAPPSVIDGAAPSTAFRLERVPPALRWVAFAGLASLAGLLLRLLRSAPVVLLLAAVPLAARAAPLLLEARVGEGPWRHQPWDPNPYRWIGYAKIRYERVELTSFRGRWEIPLTPGTDAWLAGEPPGPGLPPELGSHWFQAEVEREGRTSSSPGLAQNDPRGLSPEVQRVTFRDADDLVGHLTGYFNVPGVFGSVPWQVRNYVGVDCADVLMAALARSKGEPIERDQNVAGLTRSLRTVATATLAGGRLSRTLRWGADVRRGDFVAVKYAGWGQFGHVGALYADRNGDGLLDAEDLVLHAGPSPLHLSALGNGAFDGELRVLRPR
jgi:membrane protease YdiL (CAAX protease family)